MRLLEAFNRAPRPPAPMPTQRSSSDGGDFVAYSGVTNLAARGASAVEQNRLRALEQIADVTSASGEPPALLVPQRDLSTPSPWTSNRRLWAWTSAAAATVVALLGVVFFVARGIDRGPSDSAAAQKPQVASTGMAPMADTSTRFPSPAAALPPPVLRIPDASASIGDPVTPSPTTHIRPLPLKTPSLTKPPATRMPSEPPPSPWMKQTPL